MIDESSALAPLEPLIPNMVQWLRGAQDDTNELYPTDATRLLAGPGLLSHTLNRHAIHRMRTDGQVVGPFRPVERKKLECLCYDGTPFGIAVVIKKLERWDGFLRTCRSTTRQKERLRKGEFLIEGVKVVPLILGYENRGISIESERMYSIFIGYEGDNGYEWSRRLWCADEDQGQGAIAGPIFPLFGPTRIVPRVPTVTPVPAIGTVGTNVEKERENERREKARKKKEGLSKNEGA